MKPHIETSRSSVPWNKGRLIGQKAPLKLKESWGDSNKATACWKGPCRRDSPSPLGSRKLLCYVFSTF